eukprot:Protomagalhaensia_sp_Gyna_25__4153@NODE_3764_length_453_cov_9_016908_g3202_i0_p1_GENE_NODE_3764_length_453_cov_9_016908_g3202_i0NODE_3764_length_453_cov_9_016908_g3202_i0_p1_ORF_typecomplete_len128_score10_06_NODE_3764_length_453_cov_9_016908_g3202_i07390
MVRYARVGCTATRTPPGEGLLQGALLAVAAACPPNVDDDTARTFPVPCSAPVLPTGFSRNFSLGKFQLLSPLQRTLLNVQLLHVSLLGIDALIQLVPFVRRVFKRVATVILSAQVHAVVNTVNPPPA